MLREGGALCEGLRALLTLIRLLSGVDSQAPDQSGTVTEGSPTHITLIGPLARVYSLMLHEVGAAADSITTSLIYKASSPQYGSSGAVSGGPLD